MSLRFTVLCAIGALIGIFGVWVTFYTFVSITPIHIILLVLSVVLTLTSLYLKDKVERDYYERQQQLHYYDTLEFFDQLYIIREKLEVNQQGELELTIVMRRRSFDEQKKMEKHRNKS